MRVKRTALLAVIFVLLAAAAPVGAHAELLRSLPEANASLDRSPALVELFFSEGLEAAFSTITVLDSSGAPVDNGDSRVDPADPTRLTVSLRSLPDGVYTVSWRVLSSVDGHVTSGAFPFAVGDVDAAALAAAERASRQVRLSLGEVLARWLTYLSAAALAGGAFFLLAVWLPALKVASYPAVPGTGSLLWRRMAASALAAVLAASILALLVQAGQVNGSELAAPWTRATAGVLFYTRYGALWLARLALLLALGGLLLGGRSPRDLGLAAGAGALFLLTISLGSHAAAEPQPALPIAADWVHLLAASVWVGGLLHLAAGLWSLRYAPTAEAAHTRPRLVSVVLPRFSALALVSVAALSLTGTYMAIARLGSVEALTGTLYGRTLLVKLALALPMLVLGAVNLLWTTPRMRQAAQAGSRPARGRPSIVDRFRQLVTSEAVLGAAVLLTVGLFTALPPARTTSTQPALRAAAQADDLRLALTITPGRVGVNTFTLRVTRGGQPVIGAREVALRFTPLSGNLAPSEAVLQELGEGEYTGTGAYLSLPDAWQVQAVVRREGAFDTFANFNFSLAGAAADSSFPWNRVTGALLLLCAVLAVFAVGRLPGVAQRARALSRVLPAVALFAAGVFVFYQPPPGQRNLPVNPIPPNADSIAAGQALYEANCAACHGATGKGDGPVGLTLNPRPADLSQHALPGVHPDGQLYEWITNGFEGSPIMPAFKDVLSDTERWHLVNYIRTLPERQ